MPIQYEYEYEEYARDRTAVETLAIALGWFSIALGAAELLAPQRVARLIGVPPRERTTATLRAHGAREVASGVAILAQPTEAKWLWSRVGGDGIDLASLSAAAGQENADRTRLTIATAAVVGVAALDVLAATRLRSSDAPFEFSVDLKGEQAITLKAPLEVVEAAWVEWSASGHAKLKNNYAVRFEPAPGARGTEVHLSGGGSTGTIREELRRFKQRLETGEILLSDGPGLARPARPRDVADVNSTAEVL
jgi:hypothetical protein